MLLGAQPDIEARAMFGGHGIYLRGAFVAIAWRGRLFFKVDDASRGLYEAHRRGPFTPAPGKRLTSFFEVPEEIEGSSSELREWLDRAERAALTPSRGSSRPRSRSGSSAPP